LSGLALTLTLTLLAPTARATFITLNDFERVSLTSLPVACAIAYNTYISDCGLSDFTNGNTCSADCVAGIEDTQQAVQYACEGVSARKRSVLGMALRGRLVEDLCPNNDDSDDDGGDDEPTPTPTPTPTPAPIFSTIKPGTTTTAAAPTTERATSVRSTTTTTEASTPESTNSDALASPTSATTETPQPTSAAAPTNTTAAGDNDNNTDDDDNNDSDDNDSRDNGGGGTVGLDPERDSAGAGLPARWASRLAVGAALVVGMGLVR
jgi:hypothetical protein